MKEAYLIRAERKNRPKCMDCTWFKTDPNDLPDFGECIRNHWNVISSELACADFAYPKGGKVEGKVSDICSKCKNCKGTSWGVYDEKYKGLTEVECEDPYDGMIKTLAADSDICCSMFEPKPPCDKISLLQHELEMDKLRTKIHQLEKEKCEKKYRDEISKLQNIVTEKEVEIRGLKKDNVRLNKDISWGNMIAEKNTKLNQTISDQEITIKALLITIKEMCKDE